MISMMKHIFFCFGVVFFNFSLAGQESYAQEVISKNGTKEIVAEVGADKILNEKLLKFRTVFDNADYQLAISLAEKAVSYAEINFGPDHEYTHTSLNRLIKAHEYQGNFHIALKFQESLLETSKRVYGIEGLRTAVEFDNAAGLYRKIGNNSIAEDYLLRALTIREKLNPEGWDLSFTQEKLASLYMDRGNYAKAVTFYERSLNITKKQKNEGMFNARRAPRIANLANAYEALGERDKAGGLYSEALVGAFIVSGKTHPTTAKIFSSIGWFHLEDKNLEKAELAFLKALEIEETVLGEDHYRVALTLTGLSELYMLEGDLEKAEQLLKRIIEIRKNSYGENHLNTASSYHKLGYNYLIQNDLANAHKYFKLSAEIVAKRALGRNKRSNRSQKQSEFELNKKSYYFTRHALLSLSLINENPEMKDDLISQAFGAAQLAERTSAGSALAQATARFATNNDDLSTIIRERQSLNEEWEVINNKLSASIARNNNQRNEKNEQQLRTKLDKIDDDILKIDNILETSFPEYFVLTASSPLDIVDTRKLLKHEEALVVFLAEDYGTLVLAITKEETKWNFIDINISEALRVLRVSLENPQNAFPRGHAYGVYKKLMSGVEEIVADKDHVFLVPSGALGSIPLGVLVTEEPRDDDRSPDALRATKWWGTQQALTTLPSIPSLKALRLLAKDGRGKEPFAGFGNPVLNGSDGTDRSAQYNPRGTSAYFKGRYSDVDAVRALSSLPQTEAELMSLAKTMKSEPKLSLWLGDRATETNLKAADLSEKRVLAFATHGLMSGEMSGLSEPALVLTPPDEATDVDDGLLTASEVALLNLNADWIILSACNTAAADEPGADGLSGLARAFFYAGARSMLVSHWPVRDDAAARLTTAAISIKVENPELGRAEALRRSMVALMNDTSNPSLAHPSAWAPFVIVGEGGSKLSPNKASFDPIAFETPELKAPKGNIGATLWALIGGTALLLLAGIASIVRRRKANPLTRKLT